VYGPTTAQLAAYTGNLFAISLANHVGVSSDAVTVSGSVQSGCVFARKARSLLAAEATTSQTMTISDAERRRGAGGERCAADPHGAQHRVPTALQRSCVALGASRYAHHRRQHRHRGRQPRGFAAAAA
jgi:hypothetical protein